MLTNLSKSLPILQKTIYPSSPKMRPQYIPTKYQFMVL